MTAKVNLGFSKFGFMILSFMLYWNDESLWKQQHLPATAGLIDFSNTSMAFDLGTVRHAQCNVDGLSSDTHYQEIVSMKLLPQSIRTRARKTHKVNERNEYSIQQFNISMHNHINNNYIYILYYPPWNYPGGVVPLQIVEGHNVLSTKWMGLATGISTKWGEQRKQYKMTGPTSKQVILYE